MRPTTKPQNSFMLWLTAYLTLIGTAFGTLIGRPFDHNFIPILVVYISLGLIMAIQEKANTDAKAFLYIASLTAITCCLHFLNVESGLFLVIFFVISAQAMMMLPGIWGGVWIALLAVISGISFFLNHGVQNAILLMLVYGGGYFFFGIFGRALIDATEAKEHNRQLLEELQQTHDKLQDSVQQMEELAITNERTRLAREMHDSIGHRLTVSAVQLEGAQRLMEKDPTKSAAMIEVVRGEVRTALAELRSTVTALRQPIELDLPIDVALDRLIESFEAASTMDIQFSLNYLAPLPDNLRQVVYRTVQESLTNIQRHSGANQAWITLGSTEDQVSLTISDNGKGFPKEPEKAGYGLRGIRERTALAGGLCSFENRQAGGAKVTVTFKNVGVAHE